ncbi:LysR family transcriptional regulator [Pseudonocardia sp. MH-G8]|nr:LysR family transcriptional regulator [Pseudonocardia sp. MH-G8]
MRTLSEERNHGSHHSGRRPGRGRTVGRMRLEWLTSFVAVVDNGGFAAAANATYRSQPRVSTHIAELERRLGATVIDRHERPVKLTAAGAAFLTHARAVLRHLEAGELDVAAVLDLLRGSVSLGFYPSVGAAFVPRLLREFTRKHPDVTVSLLEAPTTLLGRALREGKVELALRPVLPAPVEPLSSHVLWEEPLVAVVPAQGHPLSGRDRVGLAEVAAHRIITIGSTTEGNQQFETQEAFRRAGLDPDIVLQTNEPQTLVALTRAGFGVGVTNALAMSISKLQGIATVPIRDALCMRQVALFWDDRRDLQPAARVLIESIRSAPPPEATAAVPAQIGSG